MEWNIEYDKYGNREWLFYINGEGHYRIVQRLKNNQIMYVEMSSSSLWIDKYSAYRDEWFNLEAAKHEMYMHYKVNKIYDSSGSIQ